MCSKTTSTSNYNMYISSLSPSQFLYLDAGLHQEKNTTKRKREDISIMYKQPEPKFFLLFYFLCLHFSFNVSFAAAGEDKSPFTVKASLIRYWNQQISNNLPKPSFLISKASPLTAVEAAFLAKLADQNALSTHLPTFCSSANLVCFTDNSPSLEKHTGDVNFAVYGEKKFTNYGDTALGGQDSFKNYSDRVNAVSDSFKHYSRNSVRHAHKFANYAPETHFMHNGSFITYGSGATGGSGDFINYDRSTNIRDLGFTSYESNAKGADQTFTAYSFSGNTGEQSFTSYGKKGQSIVSAFSSYGNNSNFIDSKFTNYGEKGKAANDSFIFYGAQANVPKNIFKNYGARGNGASENFNSYRDQASGGADSGDSFQSYARISTAGKVNFNNYGKSNQVGSEEFSGYGKASIGFKNYDANNTFTDYANKKGASFAQYTKKSSSATATTTTTTTSMAADVQSVKSTRWVEPGKFFRESNLKQGNVMPMPDIIDKMPKRSFLPRSLSSKIPFSSSKISQLKQIFHASENSSMENILKNTIQECERAPSQGETKRCVGSIEDMIDFAVSVLGRNVVVRSIDGVKGSKKDVMLGVVKGINGGKITRSVSCHQSLYPYLVYYCHSVPKVRVYVAEILDVKSKQKINTGTAICHVDTSAWSPGHGSFAALGSSPGKIEVCHWIFEGDMTWARAD